MNYCAILSVLLALSVGSFAQSSLNCQFSDQDEFGYSCLLRGAIVSESGTVAFVGQHLEGRNDNDVKGVFFTESSLTRVPMEIFRQFSNVETIDVSASQLRNFNKFENCGSLTRLFATMNQLTDVQPEAFKECSNLKELRLNRNQLRTFSNDAFKSLENLEILDLSYNMIDQINSAKLEPLKNLKKLSLNYNSIQRILDSELSSLVNLEQLTLNWNRIGSIHPNGFSGLQNLRELDLSRNTVTDITGIFRHTPALQNVTLSDNFLLQLGRNDFENNANIQIIDFQRNGINRISRYTFDHLISLRELDFRTNPCVNQKFVLNPPGNIPSIVPDLERCFY